MKSPLLLALGCCLWSAAPLRAQTDIRSSFNGKRILFVHDSDVRPDPNGKRVLFIDGDFLRPDPSGKRLLYVDQDGDIRPDLHGVRLACWDGTELRRTPGGLRLGLVDDKDFRPEPGFKTYFYMDGPPLTRMQLTAVLYLLKPEFFQISPEEKVAKEKEMAKNGAEEDARRGADQFPGEHPILAHSSTAGARRTGSVQITKQGDFYALTLKTGDNPAWQGIGVKVTTAGGDQELWAGIAPAGAVSFGVYGIKGGALSGTWIPVNAAADKSVLGYEVLTGAAQIGGVYKITAGKLPNGGVAYTGAMSIDPLSESLIADAPCYRFRWATGTTALAFRVGDRMAVAAGWGADYEVLRLRLDHADGLGGDFLGKTGAKGSYNLGK
ncbi:MAG: hypothetical protein ABJF10_23965 [Chthoniobacter sp.]|uniref:hypothetical protein n=1 Tax=Chthoniobacter sp. TaxID=2510640 RepID=UPI0032A32EAC